MAPALLERDQHEGRDFFLPHTAAGPFPQPVQNVHAPPAVVLVGVPVKIHRLLLAAGLLLCAANASAQVVYKCVQRGKPTSFQTTPCPAAAKIADIRGYAPDRELTAQEKRQREARWVTRRQAQASAAASMPTYQAPAVDHCAMVKADRDRWERSAGLNRSYDSLRAWNEQVARACR